MVDVIRAWKDERYYLSLTADQRQALPAHPAGLIELSDDDLRQSFGGSGSTNTDCSKPCVSKQNTLCVTYWCC
jgi:mersacidin/lichenicidin family type 2 lantibiotic